MRDDDARAFLEIHHCAVRGLAADDYPPEVIEAWAPLPISAGHLDFVRSNADLEYRLVAEADGEIIGIGSMVARIHELRACYVAPSASRRGVGSAILREIERAARDQGVSMLEADSSLTARQFYRANGYEECGRGEHVLNNGVRMACVKIRKGLVAPKASAIQPDRRHIERAGQESADGASDRHERTQ